MSEDEAKEIIANGCGCDRNCEQLIGADVYCGCANDAKKIVAAVRAQALDLANMKRAIHDWIREDVPLAVKMAITPQHVAKLADRMRGKTWIG